MSNKISRLANGRPAAPVKIVHLGIGNFTRAHQIWYTEKAADAAEWGVAAFTGRSPKMADTLNAQDGVYTLMIRQAAGDEYEVISAISAAHAADDEAALIEYFKSPELAIITSTVTEAGYCRGGDGHIDKSRPDVKADIATLREKGDAPLNTAPARIVNGLDARRAAGAGPIAIMPCDNLPENGRAFRAVCEDLAYEVDPSLLDWMQTNVSWVTTMVDRITPATTDEDREAVEANCGYVDASPVPTEPFSEWVICGYFPKGRPAWEGAGAQFADDVVPHEQRKLWMLNGSHSLMAYAATIMGIETVYDGITDPQVRGWVDEWWDVAAKHLPLPAEEVQAYRDALVSRFENSRIRHLLKQIAMDGSQKIPVRILPALRLDRQQGLLPVGPIRAVAAWILHLRGYGAPVNDVRGDEMVELAKGDLAGAIDRVLGAIGPDLLSDKELTAEIKRVAEELEAIAVVKP